jgi:hypothetical protein
LVLETETDRADLNEQIGREDFFDHMAEMQNRIAEISGKVAKAATEFAKEQADNLNSEKARLQKLSEWSLLGTEDKARLGEELDAITVKADGDLNGLKKLINDDYFVSSEISRIENEIKNLAAAREDDESGNGDNQLIEVSIDVPTIVASTDVLTDLIQRLEDLKNQLQEGKSIKINWR